MDCCFSFAQKCLTYKSREDAVQWIERRSGKSSRDWPLPVRGKVQASIKPL